MQRLRQVIKRVKEKQRKLGKAPRPRLPITPTKIKGVWEKRGNTFDNTMLWAAPTVVVGVLQMTVDRQDT